MKSTNNASPFKQVVIAEKPSVAADIAKALGGFTKRGSVYESDTILIAAAAGHLFEAALPKSWDLDLLPLLPEQRDLVPKAEHAERVATLVSLLRRDDVNGVINACDAGREGELIFWEIMRHVGCKKPVRRLWLQSMTAAAIRRAFAEMRPASAVQGLADAADCRALADLWVGINMTRALTGIMQRAGRYDRTPVGRVQTPTVTIVCNREREITCFVPQPYWTLTGTFVLGDTRVVEAVWTARPDIATDDRGRRIGNRERAESIMRKVEGQPASIDAKQRVEKQKPPLLFKLSDLVAECSSRFGFKGDTTQGIAQALYEKKLITYPRTESQHLRPEDDLEMVRERLAQIAAAVPALADAAGGALARGVDPANTRVFDSAKVGDHFAIIPAEIGGELPALTDPQRKVYDIILRRFVAAFLPASETTVHTVTFTAAGETFEAVTRSLCVPGWQIVDGRAEAAAPVLNAGPEARTATVASVAMEEKQTTPPRGHFTDGTLVKAMEGAGALVDDEEAQEAMRGGGLGTAATRVATIKSLVEHGYLVRRGRELRATAKAWSLMKLLERLKLEVLTSPEMTGKWEARLAEIEAGTGDTGAFKAAIRELTESLVARTINSPVDLVIEEHPEIMLPGTEQPIVELLQDYATADASFRMPKVIRGRPLLPSELHTLFTQGVVGPLEGFVSTRTGKAYPACIRWITAERRYEVFFDRDDDTPITSFPKIGVCRHCGGGVYERPSRYVCEHAVGETPTCEFKLGKLWGGHEVTRDEVIRLLATGSTGPLDGLQSRKGRAFDAALVIGDGGKPTPEFPPRKKRGRTGA